MGNEIRRTREATGKLIVEVRRVAAMANRIGFLEGWVGPPRRARGKLSKRIARIRGGVNESRRAGEQRATIELVLGAAGICDGESD